jgi:hypothetical protein
VFAIALMVAYWMCWRDHMVQKLWSGEGAVVGRGEWLHRKEE